MNKSRIIQALILAAIVAVLGLVFVGNSSDTYSDSVEFAP